MAPQLNAFGIVASDLARTVGFYRALGLPIPDGAEDAPHVEVELPGGLRLLIDPVDTIRSFDPEWSPASGGPPTALAFACDSPEDVDATYEAMTAAGHEGHLPPWDAFWGQRYATLRDPDGNGVDLYAALPTQHEETP